MGHLKRIAMAGAIAFVAVAAWSSYYTVPSDSVAVVQRFGKYTSEVATLVPVKRQLKQEFGFTTPGASDPFQSSVDGRRETALVEWVVQYRVEALAPGEGGTPPFLGTRDVVER